MQLQTYVPEPAQIMLERGVTREYLGDIREGNFLVKIVSPQLKLGYTTLEE